MTMAVFSIGQLPVEGTDDFMLQLRDYRGVLRSSLNILDGIRTGPVELSTNLEVELDSTRYHLATMIMMVEAHLRRAGTDMGASAVSVTGLQAASTRYLASLLRAKGLWNSWIDGKPLSFGGFGADGTAIPSTAAAVQQQDELLKFSEESRPRPLSKSLVYLGVGLSIAGLIYMVRR